MSCLEEHFLRQCIAQEVSVNEFDFMSSEEGGGCYGVFKNNKNTNQSEISYPEWFPSVLSLSHWFRPLIWMSGC